MCGRFALYTEPAKVARFIQAVTPLSVKWLNPGLENLEEMQGLLRPAKKGTLEHDPISRDVGKVTNDGEYLLALNSE
jgi:putative SOS response-associated peptidase YedK